MGGEKEPNRTAFIGNPVKQVHPVESICGSALPEVLSGQVRRGIKGESVTINLEDTRLDGMGPEDFPTLVSVLDA